MMEKQKVKTTFNYNFGRRPEYSARSQSNNDENAHRWSLPDEVQAEAYTAMIWMVSAALRGTMMAARATNERAKPESPHVEEEVVANPGFPHVEEEVKSTINGVAEKQHMARDRANDKDQLIQSMEVKVLMTYLEEAKLNRPMTYAKGVIRRCWRGTGSWELKWKLHE